MNLRVGHGSVVRLAEDNPAEALAEVNDAMAHWSKDAFHVEHYLALYSRVNADLYAGDAGDAYAAVARDWPRLRRSMLMTVQACRAVMRWSRGRAALALAEMEGGASRDRAELVSITEIDARALARERGAWGPSFAKLLRAGLEIVVRHDGDRARLLLEGAATSFDEAEMALHASAARRCVGQLVGGDAGRALVERADAWFTAQLVKNPSRMAAMIAPGFAGARGA